MPPVGTAQKIANRPGAGGRRPSGRGSEIAPEENRGSTGKRLQWAKATSHHSPFIPNSLANKNPAADNSRGCYGRENFVPPAVTTSPIDRPFDRRGRQAASSVTISETASWRNVRQEDAGAPDSGLLNEKRLRATSEPRLASGASSPRRRWPRHPSVFDRYKTLMTRSQGAACSDVHRRYIAAGWVAGCMQPSPFERGNA